MGAEAPLSHAALQALGSAGAVGHSKAFLALFLLHVLVSLA